MEDLVNKIRQLIEAPQWTAEDREWLLQYLKTTDTNELKALLLQKLQENEHTEQRVAPDLSRKMLDTIHEDIGLAAPAVRSSPLRIYIRRIAAAALIGLILTGGLYLAITISRGKSMREKAVAGSKVRPSVGNDVLPGKEKAILTLADGSTVSLDDAKNGTLTQQGTTKVLKLDGKLSYEASGGKLSATNQIPYNSIATPRGGQYQVVLPDGSRVWLNAASSLRFPTAFSGKERRVEVRGEAYFEVAKNASMPFTVAILSAAGGSEVQVLGTHFNINAYDDDALLKTTLLEGSVKFVNGDEAMVLNPGEQSQLARNGQLNISDRIDVSEVMAWKNGLFHFEGSDITTVMKQLSRWYDVDIVYGEKMVPDLFHAEIPRNTNLSDVLKALALTGKVEFKVEDKKIIVNQ
jgi:ferric-dicitrate binding protein FerR (iron transport regulator)